MAQKPTKEKGKPCTRCVDDDKTANDLLNATIDKLHPIFREWVKAKGFATVAAVEDIKLWYEFLDWSKNK